MKTKRLKTGGRMPGTQNKLSGDLRGKIQSIINDNIESVQADIDQLEPMQRLQILEKLMSYCVAKLQSQTIEIDMNQLSEEQINLIISQININDETEN